MITKEEYLEWRSKKDFNTKVYYSFFLDNKDPKWENISLEEFSESFKAFIEVYNNGTIQGTEGRPMKINYNKIINRCKEHFDRKFNVNL